jgi:hypothetical protein
MFERALHMTVQKARNWLVLASLMASGATFVFLLIAPAIGYPLLWADSLRILELVIPVFGGYLGAAAQYVFRNKKDDKVSVDDGSGLLALMIKGPVILFIVASIAVLAGFGISNRQSASPGAGMTVDTLAGALTAALGILAITTNAAVAYLFSVRQHEERS